MITAQLSEFRMHLKDYLDKVEEGKSIRIVRHGKPVAVLIPPADADTGKTTSRWKTPLPLIRLKGKGPTASQILIEERRNAPR
jgi:prevent-host-death family protein